MSRARRVIEGVAASGAHQVIVLAVSLLVTPLLLHTLGTEEYGTWVVLLQVVTQLSLLDLGVTPVLTRRVAQADGAGDPDAGSRWVSAAGRAMVVQQVALTTIGLVLIGFAPAQWRGPTLVILVGGTLVTFPLRAATALLRGRQEFRFITLSSMAGWATQTGLAVALVLHGFGLWSLAAAWCAGQVMQLGLDVGRLLRAHRPLLGRLRSKPTRDDLGALWREGLWVTLNRVLQAMARGLDVLLVDRVVASAAVAPYAMTTRPALIGQSFVLLALPFLSPGLAELRGSGDRAGIQRAISAVLSGMLVLQGLFAVVVLACAEEFVRLWVGSALFAGRDVLLASVFVTTAISFAAPLSVALFAVGLERRTVIANGSEALLFLGLAWLLCPALGAAGVALASGLAIVLGRLPWVLHALAGELDSASTTVWRPFARWLLRAAPAIALAGVVGPYVVGRGWTILVFTALGVAAAYATIVWSEVRSGPLHPYAERLLVWVRRR